MKISHRIGSQTMNNALENVFRSFLNQFYVRTRFVPDEVIMPVESGG